MSVAFRRDSDEEHLEPRFEIPIPPGPNIVTARGLALIRDEVARRESLLPTITEETALAAARRDLRYWRARQATAQLAPAASGEMVEFGCRVTYRFKGLERAITIVGDDEANPAAGLISFLAPLSRALLGAEVDDLVPFGGAPDAITILKIEVA